MKRRHAVRLFVLFLMFAFLLTDKLLSWNAIQKVQSNPKEYFFVNSEPIQTVHVGIYNDNLLVGYRLFSSREQVEIDYSIGDLKREYILRNRSIIRRIVTHLVLCHNSSDRFGVFYYK